MSKPLVLVVDDEAGIRESLSDIFSDEGYQVATAKTGEEALGALDAPEPDLVLLDIWLPGMDGLEALEKIKRKKPGVPVIMISGHGTIEMAVRATRNGAYDFLEKPLSLERVILVSKRALERKTLELENRDLKKSLTRKWALVGETPVMKSLMRQIGQAAKGHGRVLITGESGTGKEVVARTIHYSGNRAERPFVPINCTAIPEGLLESELFGHVRGAFTGAHTTKQGLFEKADGGTLFLDEIGDMSLALQGKLLRVLQDREVRAVGGTQVTKVDLRIIAATNRVLVTEMEAENFREDLYYRLNVIPIYIPPLRERPQDVPPLAKAFVAKHSPDRPRTISSSGIRYLAAFPWKGNARELENVIERALALSDATVIDVEDLRLDPAVCEGRDSSPAALTYAAAENRLTLRELEDRYIEEVMRITDGNKVHAAKILGIDRKTLYRRAERDNGKANSA